jgi:hypothetical protein
MCLRMLPRLLVLLSVLPVVGHADTVVTRLDHESYSVRMEVQISAPSEYVRALLTDYEHLNRVNPSIRQSQLLGSFKPDQVRVRTVTRSCVVFMCFDMTQVQDVEVRADGEIISTIVPGKCDFKDGVALWRILPSGTGTHVVFEARMRPAFWVPPLIGMWMIERQIDQQLALTVSNLDRLGKQLAMR